MPFRPFQNSPISLGNLQDEMTRLVERIWHAGLSTGPLDGQQWAPTIDLCEHQDHYVAFVDVPGVDPAKIEVTHCESTLTVRGERCGCECEEGKGQCLQRERRVGTFCRKLELPGDIDAARLSAKCQHGVLEITIPKSAASMPKSVKIEVADE
ncbi:MAG: Hsp20/alpha crystallin family protein [Planctomycetes bacterium]|nr:Hsp20/alpha crystallin family protein [Planctomycetota bacterium]